MYNDKILAYNTLSLFQQEKSFKSNSALANVFIGVGHTWCDRYFLGLEANSYFPHHNASWLNRPGVTTLGYQFANNFTIQNYINLDLNPGYRINPDWLIYGRVGLAFADISTYEEANTIAGVPPYANSNPTIGGRFGAGVNYQLNQHVGAGVDYFYAYFPQNNSTFNDRQTVLGITSHYNYIGFSLFYTV